MEEILCYQFILLHILITVQECDATMLNSYSSVRLIKIFFFTHYTLFTTHHSPSHSVLKLFTGLANATLKVFKPAINKASNNTSRPLFQTICLFYLTSFFVQ